MRKFIKSCIKIICLSAFVVSCSVDDDSGHVIVKPNKVEGSDTPTKTNTDNNDKKEVLEDKKTVETDKETNKDEETDKEEEEEEKVEEEEKDTDEIKDFESLSVYINQLSRIEDLREYMQNEITDFADERIIDELHEFEDQTFSKLYEVVQKHSLDDLDAYIKAVNTEMGFYELDINVKWTSLEDSL